MHSKSSLVCCLAYAISRVRSILKMLKVCGGSLTICFSDVVRGLESACDDEAQHSKEVIHQRYVHLASMLHEHTSCLSR